MCAGAIVGPRAVLLAGRQQHLIVRPGSCSRQSCRRRGPACSRAQSPAAARGSSSSSAALAADGTAAHSTQQTAAAAAAEQEAGEYHSFFREQWGPRWPALFASLVGSTRHVALHNSFLPRPPSPGDLPHGAAPLAARQPALAAALDAAGRAAGGCRSGESSSSSNGSNSSSSQAAEVIQAWHWEPSPPAATSPSQPGSQAKGRGQVKYPPPPADPASGLTTHYWLDPASLLPPLLLGVRPGQAVLDMCAAPGGKSFVLAQLLFAGGERAAAAAGAAGAAAAGDASADEEAADEAGAYEAAGSELVCNEIDASRRGRLVRVLKQYVPEAARQRIRVTPHDAARWWGRQEGESFDRVLLDAPCSSDRHVAQQAAARGSFSVHRSDWTAQRCRQLGRDQAKLLEAGVKALRPGGRLVYSTCSIAAVENDEVVDRLLAKAGGSVAVISHTLRPPSSSSSSTASSSSGSSSGDEGDRGAAGGDKCSCQEAAEQAAEADEGGEAADEAVAALEAMGAERTRHGWLLLPDAAGCGPIFLAVLHKLASSELRRVKVNRYERHSAADRPAAP